MSVRRRKMQQSGSTLLEFAIVVPCLMSLFFGTVGLGIMMGRYIQAEQMCRDIAHMYSDGVDFTQTTPQNIVVQKLGAGTGITANGGDGVVILSQVQTVYASDCTAAGVSPCTNQGLPVFTQTDRHGEFNVENQCLRYPCGWNSRRRREYCTHRIPQQFKPFSTNVRIRGRPRRRFCKRRRFGYSPDTTCRQHGLRSRSIHPISRHRVFGMEHRRWSIHQICFPMIPPITSV